MIAVDSNLLVYAHREDSEWHTSAYACLQELAEGREAWGIPWPCLHEFLAIVTHARIYAPPTPIEAALDQARAWLESPNLVLLGEAENYFEYLQRVLRTSRAGGPQVHDARVAALCVQNGITELWTADRDFSRFPVLKTRNPLIA